MQALAPSAEQLRQRAVERIQRARARDGEDRRAVDEHSAQPVAPAVGVPVERGAGHGSGALLVEPLQQVVSRELDLLVAPLGGPVQAGDQAHPVDAAEVSRWAWRGAFRNVGPW